MKGMVFTELLAMAEQAVGETVVDEVLDDLDLASGGAYTSVGNYPCSELVAIVVALSARTGLPAEELQRQFGHWIFDGFKKGYPQFFENKSNALQMLDAIDSEVHVEVRKLFPDAELPRFETRSTGPDRMDMIYHSDRPLVAFCHGLIEACVAYFEQPAEIAMRPGATANSAVFDIRLVS